MNTETRTLNNPQKDSLHLKRSFTIMASFTVALWLIKIVELLIGAELFKYGIYPGQLSGLTGIFLSPLIHSSFSHLFANTAPLLYLAQHFYTDTRNQQGLLYLLSLSVPVWVSGFLRDNFIILVPVA